ncbi:MAG: FAD-dependent oxidoreductase, partial [Patescibacteria group bacterium]
FAITVRAIGEFSNRLCALKPGDTVYTSLPYGFFYPEHEDSDLVMLASGIGITPFRSMIVAAAANRAKRRIMLFHSVRTAADALFRDEYEALRKDLPGLSLAYFVTRDAEAPAYALHRRMNAGDILPGIANPEHTEFLLCGSISFTRDLWRELRAKGVRQDAMYTEAFFSN